MGNSLSPLGRPAACHGWSLAQAPSLDRDSRKLIRAVKKGDLPALSRQVESGKVQLHTAAELLSGHTALHIAAKAGNIQLLIYLLECPHGVAGQDHTGLPVSTHGSSETAYLWINARTRKGYTALTVATRSSHVQAVELLLRYARGWNAGLQHVLYSCMQPPI